MPVFPHAESWEYTTGEAWLAQQLDGSLTLVWTDNRSSMIGVRGNRASGYRLRLHHMFQHAPFPIWQALATFIRAPDATARQTLRAYIQHHQWRIRASTPRTPLPSTVASPRRLFRSGRDLGHLKLHVFCERYPRTHYLDATTAAAAACLDSFRFVSSAAAVDTYSSSFRSGVCASVCRRKRRVSRNAASTDSPPTFKRPLGGSSSRLPSV